MLVVSPYKNIKIRSKMVQNDISIIAGQKRFKTNAKHIWMGFNKSLEHVGSILVQKYQN